MPISRRSFLKYGAGGLVLTGFGFDVTPIGAESRPLPVTRGWEAPSICPYCSVGCGIVVHGLGGDARHGPPAITQIEGDPDHPISQGALCSKGAALKEFIYDPNRLSTPLYRARPTGPAHTDWREVTWGFAIDALARRIKETRDSTFMDRDGDGRVVNRLEAIAFMGGAADTNEMNYLAAKTMRSLGLVYMEQQSRMGHAASAGALAATVGLSGMMTTWVDLRNSDVILVMGGNPAETQPVGFHWVLQARRQRGAKLLCVDMRLTRTAALADHFVPIRASADLALLGGFIHYTLSNDLHHAEYVRLFTNAPFIVREGFDFQNGWFSGYDAAAFRYDVSTWAYESASDGSPMTDPTLQHPRCVFQLLKAHFSRYTPRVVSDLTGLAPEAFESLAALVCSTGRPDRAGAILYAAGWAQHSNGVQTIRAAAVLQLLLGNIGRSGGGLNALHGHANTQGSSAHGLASNELPGHLPLPQAEHVALSQYLDAHSSSALAAAADGGNGHSKYFVSLMTAWYGRGDAANPFGYDYLPKPGADAGWPGLYDAMLHGKVEGLLVFGANPLASAPNTSRMLRALSRLKWLAVIDCFETETAQFWRAPGTDPYGVATEVFLLPAAIFAEKTGSVTNACRWTQWRRRLVDPPGGTRPDLDILASLWVRVRELYQAEGGAYPNPILHLNWPYADPRAPQPEEIAHEINGVALDRIGSSADQDETPAGARLTSPTKLREDGATACGNWLYCGSFPDERNLMARRSLDDPTGLGLYPEWSWASPADQRLLFNRAGADRAGAPWDPTRAALFWSGREWFGDVTDHPHALPEQSLRAFTMLPEGVARLFVPSLADGPFPEHYEPFESPITNVLHPDVSSNPLRRPAGSELDKYGRAPDYPVICTTYRLAEHFHWWTSHLRPGQEWQPDFFIELPEGLAQELRVHSGDPIRVASARGLLEGRALVTRRIQPLMIAGRPIWQIGLPIHGGYSGRLTGPLVNRVTPAHTDPTSGVPEFKAFLVRVEKM